MASDPMTRDGNVSAGDYEDSALNQIIRHLSSFEDDHGSDITTIGVVVIDDEGHSDRAFVYGSFPHAAALIYHLNRFADDLDERFEFGTIPEQKEVWE